MFLKHWQGFSKGSRSLQDGGIEGVLLGGGGRKDTSVRLGNFKKIWGPTQDRYINKCQLRLPKRVKRTQSRSVSPQPPGGVFSERTARVQKPLISFPVSLSVCLPPRPEPWPTHASDHP